ncbi:unnamed protein product [Effrenium voratum]|nr:unnamed protein product [Effrenium voratum]
MVAARMIVAIENPSDIIVASQRPYGSRAVLKFSQYTGANPLAGRWTPGTLTNQITQKYLEPRLLIVTDPRTDSQAIKEASYASIPVIALCDTDSPLENVDVTYLEPSVLEEPVTVLSIKRRLAKQLGCSIFGLRLLHEDKVLSAYTTWESLGFPTQLSAVQCPYAGADSLDQQLISAVTKENAGEVERILSQGQRPNCALRGTPLLCIAARQGQMEVARFLVEAAADVNLGDCMDETPLMRAARAGHLDMVNFLLDEKAEINQCDCQDANALIWAAREGREHVTKRLILVKADIRKETKQKATALVSAAGAGHCAVLRCLLDAKAEANQRCYHGASALMWTAEEGQLEAAQFLLQARADVDQEDEQSSSALHWAAEAGHEAVVELLLAARASMEKRNKFGATALKLARDSGQLEALKVLQDAGASAD